MGPRDHERAADVDREAVAERLRQAVAEGRLDLDEYDERLGKTYAAKTYGELDRVVVDLPKPRPAPLTGPEIARRYPHAARQWLAEQWRPWGSVVVICFAIWLLTSVLSGGLIDFWPAWVAVPWGAVLLCRSIYGISSGEPQHWAANRARPPGPRRSC
jgi:hypothetical protein